jgi:hypothetical protein
MRMLSMRQKAARLAATLSLAAIASCGGGQHEGAAAFWEGGSVKRATPEEERRGTKAPRRPVGVTDEFHGAPSAPQEKISSWVGVRHDLALAPSPQRKERCSCLAVEVGEARDPRFQWAAGAPEIGADAIAIALSARGVPCPDGAPDEDKRRASISAVDQDGNDIIVEIEELPPGRPLATGAVIPRPAPGGAIYVKGRTPQVPYARAPGGARCRVF